MNTLNKALAVLFMLIVFLSFGLYYFKKPAIVSKSVPKEPMKIKYYIIPDAANELRSLIIKKYGIDKKHNLDIEFISSDPGTVERKLIDGEVDIAEVSPFSLIAAYTGGHPAKVIVPSLYFPYAVAVPKNSTAKTVQDLKGMRLGVLPKASAGFAALVLTFKSVGMDPEKDFKLMFGNITQTVGALQAHEVDAAVVSYPSAARVFGTAEFRNTGRLEKLWGEKEGFPMIAVVVAAKNDWVNNNRDAARALAATIFEASKFIQKKPGVIAELTDYMQKYKYNTPEMIRLLQENVPGLYFTRWTDVEVNALQRLFQRAKEIGIIPDDAPPMYNLILTPAELGL